MIPTLNRTPLLTAILAACAAALLLLAACGGDDDDNDDASPSASASDNGDEPTSTEADGSPITTPGGSPGVPADCTEGDAQRGLLSELTFGEGLFDVGEDVELTMTLINCGDNELELSFPTAQRYLVTIASDPGGVEVWNSADGKSFDQAEGTESIPEGETIVYTETWNQQDSGGQQVAEGRYKVSFFSVGCGQAEATECRFGPIKFIEIGEVPETDEAGDDEAETPEAS